MPEEEEEEAECRRVTEGVGKARRSKREKEKGVVEDERGEAVDFRRQPQKASAGSEKAPVVGGEEVCIPSPSKSLYSTPCIVP